MSAARPPATPTHRDGPLAFVDDLDVPELDPDDHHHLARVLRVRDGAPMVVCDGAGSWRRATFGERPGSLGPPTLVPRPSPALTVGFALVKGDRPEWVVQKLTELGVDRLVPFVSEHTVVRHDRDRAAKVERRFTRIAREAAMQCRRVHLPVVEPVTTFSSAVSLPGPVVLADADGSPLIDTVIAGTMPLPAVILVGPEGGWSDAERSAGPDLVRIGDHILRAETAAVAAATLLTALRSGLAGGERAAPLSSGDGG